MPSQSPHLDTTPVVRNVRSLDNRQNQQKRGHSGNSQLPPAKRRVLVLAGVSDSSQGGSSVASTIQGQNSIPSSWLNNSRIEDITQRVTATPSATQRRSIITPTTRLVTCSRGTPHPEEHQRVALHPAPHSALLSFRLLLAVLKTCRPPSLIQKPARSLQIHSECALPKRITDRGSGNCNRRRCLHLDQWSPAVAASIDLVTQT